MVYVNVEPHLRLTGRMMDQTYYLTEDYIWCEKGTNRIREGGHCNLSVARLEGEVVRQTTTHAELS
jgi:hypothetical protein